MFSDSRIKPDPKANADTFLSVHSLSNLPHFKCSKPDRMRMDLFDQPPLYRAELVNIVVKSPVENEE